MVGWKLQEKNEFYLHEENVDNSNQILELCWREGIQEIHKTWR